MTRDTGENAEPTGMNRRTMLKGTATAAVGLVGLTGTAAGFQGDDGNITGSADFPRATTRGHFDINWLYEEELTDGHTKWDYGTVGDIPGYGSANPEEVVISVHGWLVGKDDAPDHFATVEAALRDNGYSHPVIGFSYDSDTRIDQWWPATDIAERNGAKLANFIADYRARTGARVRIIGHSLGGRVVPETIKSLHDLGYNDYVESVTLLGGASDDESVAVDGEYGPAIGTVVGQFDNFWKSDDQVLTWAYGTAEFDSAVGESGCEGTPPANYEDHQVDYVPDHFSYYEPGDGCMLEVVGEFS